MSSKIIGRGLGWQISDLKKNQKETLYSEKNLKKVNPTFLPEPLLQRPNLVMSTVFQL